MQTIENKWYQKGMKNNKTALALDFFCGMLRFRTREAAIF
jgi:hypothetical protein